jgi:erythromycin esterase-like protein
LVATSDQDRYSEAVHYASLARQLLNYHAAVAPKSDYAGLPSIRDASMADNLADTVDRDRRRGKVLAFAHNSHVQRGKAVWPWYTFWPAGSHLREVFGSRYAVIGSAVGVSDANGIGRPEAGSLEARLTALPEPAVFIPTHKRRGLPESEVGALPTRSGSMKNPSYVPLAPQSFTDFDWQAVLDSTAYSRVGRRCNSGTPAPRRGHLTEQGLLTIKPLASRKSAA